MPKRKMIVQEVQTSCFFDSSLSNTTDVIDTQPVEYKLAQIPRQCLIDNFQLGRIDRSVRFEVAQPEDHHVVHSFILNEFGFQEPLNRAVELTPDDLNEPIKKLLMTVLPQRASILVVDGGVLIGIIINSIAKTDRSAVKEPKIQNDYGNELDVENGISSKLKRIYTILDEMELFLPNFLPSNCTQYLKVDIMSVQPKFAGCGLGKQLMIESFKLAHATGIGFCVAICTATASTRISSALGLKQVFSFPYDKYKYHGKPAFTNKIHDGSESANLMIGDLNEIVSKL